MPKKERVFQRKRWTSSRLASRLNIYSFLSSIICFWAPSKYFCSTRTWSHAKYQLDIYKAELGQLISLARLTLSQTSSCERRIPFPDVSCTNQDTYFDPSVNVRVCKDRIRLACVRYTLYSYFVEGAFQEDYVEISTPRYV